MTGRKVGYRSVGDDQAEAADLDPTWAVAIVAVVGVVATVLAIVIQNKHRLSVLDGTTHPDRHVG